MTKKEDNAKKEFLQMIERCIKCGNFEKDCKCIKYENLKGKSVTRI